MTEHDTQADDSRILRWATWRTAIGLAIAIALVRLAFLMLVSPYELVADEAQYWDWSRHLDLSYYTKGPGVAWTIAASTSILGNEEWAIRTPAVLSSLVTMLAVAGLTWSISDRSQRAACLAALAYCFVPAYHGTSVLMTIDAPYIAAWILAAWAAWSALDRRSIGRWALFGALVGIGFLYKYTILLLPIGVLVATVAQPRWRSRTTVVGLALALLTFVVVASPVIIWNARNDWPTIAHLLGHLGLRGGDMIAEASAPWRYDPMWTLEFVGSQLLLIGPMLAVMLIGARATLREAPDSRARRGAAFCIWCAAPILVFYLLVTLLSDAEGNWPIAGYTTLIVPGAILAARELPRYRTMVAQWRADPSRPRRGILRRQPETPFQIAWHTSAGFGIVTFVGLMLIGPVSRVPGIGPLVPLGRFTGFGDYAQRVHDRAIVPARALGRGEPIVITQEYGLTAMLAYYLPDRPVVFSAAHALGGRRSSYDYFPQTDLHDPALAGRPAILVGANPVHWTRALRISEPDLIFDASGRRHAVYLAERFDGVADSGASD